MSLIMTPGMHRAALAAVLRAFSGDPATLFALRARRPVGAAWPDFDRRALMLSASTLAIAAALAARPANT